MTPTKFLAENTLGALLSILLSGMMAFADALSAFVAVFIVLVVVGVGFAVRDYRRGLFSIRGGWKI